MEQLILGTYRQLGAIWWPEIENLDTFLLESILSHFLPIAIYLPLSQNTTDW